MSATVTLDPAVPITEQFGARFLTPAEARELDIDRTGDMEMVEMNLRHISDAGDVTLSLHAPSWYYAIEDMTLDQLAAMILFADGIRTDAQQRLEWADSIEQTAKRLYWLTEEGQGV
jgi:hypothetical protein